MVSKLSKASWIVQGHKDYGHRLCFILLTAVLVADITTAGKVITVVYLLNPVQEPRTTVG